jgi:exopolysaccharide production protein ExoQ
MSYVAVRYESDDNVAALAYRAESGIANAHAPVYQQVLTWLLMLPLLNMVAKGALSFLNPTATAFNYQNAYLAKTAQGIRLPVVINLLLLAGFAVAGNRKVRCALADNKVILLTLLFAGLSALWSADPMITLRMTIEVSLSTLFACYLSARMSTERLMSLLIILGVIAAFLSILLAVFLPQYGIFQGYGGGAWQGICIHKNTLGMSMAFLLTPIFFVKRPRALKIAYSALLLFLIAMSQSRSAWLETAGVLLFIAWLALFRRLRGKESLTLTLASVAMLIGIAVIGISHLAPIARMIGKDPTLTGRTGIYAAVLESIFKHPILGYGFGAFWKFNPESLNIAIRIGWINIGYAENGLLDLWLQVGAVGVGLVLIMFGRAVKQIAWLIRSPYYSPRIGWFSAVIVLELITNVGAGWLMAGETLDWALTLIACIGLAAEVRKINESKRQVRTYGEAVSPLHGPGLLA